MQVPCTSCTASIAKRHQSIETPPGDLNDFHMIFTLAAMSSMTFRTVRQCAYVILLINSAFVLLVTKSLY